MADNDKLLSQINEIVIQSTPETVDEDIRRAGELIGKMSDGEEKDAALMTTESLQMLKKAKELTNKAS